MAGEKGNGAARETSHGDAGEANPRRDIKLGFLIHDVSRLRRKAFDQFMKPLGITRAQWWVLAFLSRQDGMMQVQLADLLDVGKASLGTIIERLEAGGWVERRADAADKRAKRVYLARNAQQLLEQMTVAERMFNQRAMVNLTSADRANLIRLLSSFKETLSQMNFAGKGGAADTRRTRADDARTAIAGNPAPTGNRRATQRALARES